MLRWQRVRAESEMALPFLFSTFLFVIVGFQSYLGARTCTCKKQLYLNLILRYGQKIPSLRIPYVKDRQTIPSFLVCGDPCCPSLLLEKLSKTTQILCRTILPQSVISEIPSQMLDFKWQSTLRLSPI